MEYHVFNKRPSKSAVAVKRAYDDIAQKGMNNSVCYGYAVEVARELGGVEIDNSNNKSIAKSFAPNITFEFDDSSTVEVTYGGVFL